MNETANAAGGLGERINEAVATHVVFKVSILGHQFPISDTVITTWVIMVLLVLGAIVATRKLSEVPRGFQIALESFVDLINNLVKNNMGHHWKAYAPFIGTIALYLGVANVVPFFTPVAFLGHEPPFPIKPPTRDINITSAFAFVSICTVIFSSIRYKGPLGWLKSLAAPTPMMLPFNILEYFIRPLSLSLRLFGNILGAFIIMQLIEAVAPLVVPPVLGLYFDFFDGLIQAVIFTFLSTIFIAEAIE